jgi:hypothetical protein
MEDVDFDREEINFSDELHLDCQTALCALAQRHLKVIRFTMIGWCVNV